MIDVLRIAHLRIAPQEGNSEVGNSEVHPIFWFCLMMMILTLIMTLIIMMILMMNKSPAPSPY